MPGPDPVDHDGLFDADYLWFYDTFLTADLAVEETDRIVALAGLRPGQRILDAGCGHGRLTAEFARRGLVTVGLDRSAVFLAEAVRRAPGLGGHVVRGDFAGLPVRDGAHDAVVCWFTAFGLGTDRELALTLREFARVLAPGGRLVLDLPARARLLERIPTGGPLVDRIALGRDVLRDETGFDAATDRLQTERFISRSGRVRHLRYTVRLFSPETLNEWLVEAGFGGTVFSDEHGAPFSAGARRMVACSSRS